MLINKINIKNFKSLSDISIINPNPFSVFFGTNAAGKSNIFEALELASFSIKRPDDALSFFADIKDLFTIQNWNNRTKIEFEIDTSIPKALSVQIDKVNQTVISKFGEDEIRKLFGEKFSRIFLGNKSINKEIFKDDKKLLADGSNTDKVLGRLLKDQSVREDIVDWLQFIIPEFKNIEVKQNELTGEDYIVIWEEYSSMPFTGNLISDGTKNSISLITSIYQSNEPQFLLIEEPENGLNPKVIKEFVQVCREFVREKDHTIWLATHSQTLVSEIKPSEAILVFKENGFTQVKQFHDFNLYDLKMDDAWLSNVLGGGIPW
jgi:predicted ATPase